MRLISIGAAAFAAAILACSGSAGSGAKLSVSSKADSRTTSTTPPATTCDVTLDEVRLVVRHLQIEGGDLCAPQPPAQPPPTMPGLRTSADHGGSCQDGLSGSDGGSCDGEHDGTCEDRDHDGLDDDCADDDGECELKFGPFPVVLSATDLATGVVSYEFDVTVPPGTYDELEILVNTIPASMAGGNAVLEEMAAEHASVLVRGKAAGKDFTWKTNVAFTQEREPFTVPPEGANVTLQLDTSGWFVDGSTCLDPNDPDARTRIARNIRASFRMLHDDDRDGQDDDHEGDGHR